MEQEELEIMRLGESLGMWDETLDNLESRINEENLIAAWDIVAHWCQEPYRTAAEQKGLLINAAILFGRWAEKIQ